MVHLKRCYQYLYFGKKTCIIQISHGFVSRREKKKSNQKGGRIILVRTVMMCHVAQDVIFPCIYAISSQNIITRATNRKSRDRNCSSMCCGVPGAAGGGLPSLMLNAVAKIPNGKAPIPNDIWKPPSPKPNP